jgi:multiple sugar transport system substrate-binding protein
MALGETPYVAESHIVSEVVGCAALARLRELIVLCDPGCWARNPIASHDIVASDENAHVAYCPLAYGYSNYARAGYAAHRLTFGEPPSLGGAPLRSTLGGTGLGISALRQNRQAALAYAQFAASGEIQRTLYTSVGGQAGHRTAWTDPDNNRIANNYFSKTLPALDRAYLRPRYSGYMEFQEKAGPIVHAALRSVLADTEALRQLEALYQKSNHSLSA